MLNGSQTAAPGTTEDTLGENLKVYNIASKLKRLRLRKSMGLAELASHTGLSPAMLSKLENGRVIPTLQTLTRIALVFSVGLEHFFDRSGRFSTAIVKPEERQSFDEKMGTNEAVYRFECLDYKAVDRKANAFLAHFTPCPPEDMPMHQHNGGEFIYVLTGLLGLKQENEEAQLRAGDSLYFDSSIPHGYRQIGADACRALVVAIP